MTSMCSCVHFVSPFSSTSSGPPPDMCMASTSASHSHVLPLPPRHPAHLSFTHPPPCAHPGSHILSGNVLETRALDELLPGWKADPDSPIKVWKMV